MQALQHSPYYHSILNLNVQILRKHFGDDIESSVIRKCADELTLIHFKCEKQILENLMRGNATLEYFLKNKYQEISQICEALAKHLQTIEDIYQKVNLSELMIKNNYEFAREFLQTPVIENHDNAACTALMVYNNSALKDSSTMKKIAGQYGTTVEAMKFHWECIKEKQAK